MKLNDFRFATDLFDENEIKKFETKNMKFSHSLIYPPLNSEPIIKIGKMFVFTTKDDFEICFDFVVGSEYPNGVLFCMDIRTIKNRGWATEMDTVFLPDYLDDVHPVLLYLEKKMKELPDLLKQNKSLRLPLLMGSDSISFYNHSLDTYEKIKKVKNSPDFETIKSWKLQKLKKYKII